jgi:DNA-directed RNA polymerase specialized sigma24 family protein
MSASCLFTSAAEVVHCLLTYSDWYQPASASVLKVGARRTKGAGDGMHPNLLETLDERRELRRLVALLTDKERDVLILWYVAQATPSEIARAVSASQRQVYRIRGRAVRRIVELGRPEEEAVA